MLHLSKRYLNYARPKFGVCVCGRRGGGDEEDAKQKKRRLQQHRRWANEEGNISKLLNNANLHLMNRLTFQYLMWTIASNIDIVIARLPLATAAGSLKYTFSATRLILAVNANFSTFYNQLSFTFFVCVCARELWTINELIIILSLKLKQTSEKKRRNRNYNPVPDDYPDPRGAR